MRVLLPEAHATPDSALTTRSSTEPLATVFSCLHSERRVLPCPFSLSSAYKDTIPALWHAALRLEPGSAQPLSQGIIPLRLTSSIAILETQRNRSHFCSVFATI